MLATPIVSGTVLSMLSTEWDFPELTLWLLEPIPEWYPIWMEFQRERQRIQ